MALGDRTCPSALLLGSCLLLVACDGQEEKQQPLPTDAPSAGAQPWFEEVSESSGLDFHHVSGHTHVYYTPEIMAGGVALFDMDGDGDLDIYLVQSGEVSGDPEGQPGNRLFRNDGSGTFTDVTAGSGADDARYGVGVAAADVDNDGDVDLYVTNVGRNTLLRNDGGGRFADITDNARVGDPGWGESAAFLDYDADGDLDLFVCNYVVWSPQTEIDCTDAAGELDYCTPESYNAPAPDVLYRNNGDGTFTDVSVEARLRTSFGNGLGVVCGDLTGDHHVDIYVANDKTPNQLWRNNGDGTFTDVAPMLGCAVDMQGLAKAGMGTIAMDVDDDGDLDVMVVNLQGETDTLYVNHGTYFADETARAGLAVESRRFTRFGMALADFNNDGQLDAYFANGRVYRRAKSDPLSDDPYAEANLLMSGTASGRFEAVERPGGTAQPLVHTSRGAAFGDLDNDGGLDIVVVNRDARPYLLRNVLPDRGHWISLHVLNEHGSDALGARVQMDVGERTVTRDVRAAYSYCASNDPRIHVGLGDATTVRNVRVTWPDGSTEAIGDLPADRVHVIRPAAPAHAGG